MNEELLNSALLELIEGIRQTKDFAIEQAPDVIQQMLVWEFTHNLIWFIVGLVFLSVPILFLATCQRVRAKIEEDRSLREFHACGGTVISGAFLFFAAITMNSNLGWLQIWLAPKVYILEYAANLI